MSTKMKADEIVSISLNLITPFQGNRRIGGFNTGKIKELADSIKAVGVIQPAVVRRHKEKEKYQLIAGERRWRAAKIAGLAALPCVIREISNKEILKIQTIENLQREGIHPLDEMEGYQRLIDQEDYDVEQLAKEIGKSISYIYQRLKLQDLIPEARQLLIDGEITPSHAIPIARLSPEHQKEFLENHLTNQWRDNIPSVKDLKRSILGDIENEGEKEKESILVEKEQEIRPYKKTHILLSFSPDLFIKIQPLIEKILSLGDIEYEQGSN